MAKTYSRLYAMYVLYGLGTVVVLVIPDVCNFLDRMALLQPLKISVHDIEAGKMHVCITIQGGVGVNIDETTHMD